jgi:nicotinate dehydrogenase subunit B
MGPSTEDVIAQRGDVDRALAADARVLSATYLWPFQSHGSIGPSSAVADVRADGATIWSGTQSVYALRGAIAKLLKLSDDAVRVIYVEAAGCYGHNGSDDAAADAAVISQSIGKPVHVQWSLADELGWDPKGPAMVMELRGALGASGKVAGWSYEVWTPTHANRAVGRPGNLLAAQLAGIPAAEGYPMGGDRNARSNYRFPNERVVVHWKPTSALRQSALRSLGGAQNTFANESFMDELAFAAGADPIDFRLAHLDDPRGRAVLETVASRAGWQRSKAVQPTTDGATVTGRGVAFARYDNESAYVAAVADCELVPSTGAVRVREIYVAHDCGQIVNPDGLRNQIEGNAIQATSRSLMEEVHYDRQRVTSIDWESYPILRFPEIPDVHVELIDRPDEPPLGAGEPTTVVIAPAIANAIFAASGIRVRRVPFTPERVRAARNAR